MTSLMLMKLCRTVPKLMDSAERRSRQASIVSRVVSVKMSDITEITRLLKSSAAERSQNVVKHVAITRK